MRMLGKKSINNLGVISPCSLNYTQISIEDMDRKAVFIAKREYIWQGLKCITHEIKTWI